MVQRSLKKLVPVLLLVSVTGLEQVRTIAAQSQELPKGVELVASVEGLTEYRLANGLRVLLFPDQSKQTVTVNVTYLVGSRHESYGETGMAHLLEHMMYKGSKNHPNIPQELTEHGSRVNGSTLFDRTNYFEVFSATDANLDWAIKMEADRMTNSFIAKKDLDSEMTVVRNEYENQENQPPIVAYKRIFAAAYDWHNYSKPPLGTRSDIENVPIDRLQAFYRKYYQPDNAVLLVAGKFDPAKTLNLVAETFGAIPRPARTLDPGYTIEPTQDGERVATSSRVGDTQFVGIGYHVPPGSHPDFAAVSVLLMILADAPSGRLHKSLIAAGKASSIETMNIPMHDPGLMVILAEVRKEQSLDDARNTMIRTIEEVARKAPTQEEVDRERGGLLKNIDLTLKSAQNIGLELSEWIAQGDWRLFFLHRDRLKKVTPADVQRVASAYLKPTNRTVGLFIPTEKPDRAEIPPAPDVPGLVKDYKGSAALVEGEAFEPSPQNIESRTLKSELPVGMKLALLSKKTRGNVVAAAINLRFGDQKSLMNGGTAGQLTVGMLLRGTAKHTRQQIQEEFDKLKARVSTFAGINSANISIETIRESLPAVLRLVAEIVREPSFPAGEFDQLKQETLASIEQLRRDPQALAAAELSRHMSPFPKGDARYTSTAEERIDEVNGTTPADLKKFYAEFYGATYADMSVVGDFDAREIEKLTGELFNGWKSPRPYARITTAYEEIPPINKSFETPDKANAMFFAGQRLKLRDDDPDYPAFLMANYVLGGGLRSRLTTRLRQKEGFSYGAASGLQINPLDNNAQFFVQALCAPQNVAKVEAAVREEIERALKDGFAADEVEGAKSGWIQSSQVSRAQDLGLARKLALYRYYNRTFAWDAEFERKIVALTPEQINAALRKYLDLSKMSIVKAGDFAKSAGKTEAKSN